MQINGEVQLEASPEEAWALLNDPKALEQCIPGCESLQRLSDTEFTAAIRAKIGPVKTLFQVKIQLQDLNPPQSYTIIGQGKGGVAGFGSAKVKVRLRADGDGTMLSYHAELSVGGKLARIGSRLIISAAHQIIDGIFLRIEKQLSAAIQLTDNNKIPSVGTTKLPFTAGDLEKPQRDGALGEKVRLPVED